MPDPIRHPDVVPTKVGNHIKDWVPVFTGNPVSSDNYENTGHRFSPVRRLFTKPSYIINSNIRLFSLFSVTERTC